MTEIKPITQLTDQDGYILEVFSENSLGRMQISITDDDRRDEIPFDLTRHQAVKLAHTLREWGSKDPSYQRPSWVETKEKEIYQPTAQELQQHRNEADRSMRAVVLTLGILTALLAVLVIAGGAAYIYVLVTNN